MRKGSIRADGLEKHINQHVAVEIGPDTINSAYDLFVFLTDAGVSQTSIKRALKLGSFSTVPKWQGFLREERGR